MGGACPRPQQARRLGMVHWRPMGQQVRRRGHMWRATPSAALIGQHAGRRWPRPALQQSAAWSTRALQVHAAAALLRLMRRAPAGDLSARQLVAGTEALEAALQAEIMGGSGAARQGADSGPPVDLAALDAAIAVLNSSLDRDEQAHAQGGASAGAAGEEGGLRCVVQRACAPCPPAHCHSRRCSWDGAHHAACQQHASRPTPCSICPQRPTRPRTATPSPPAPPTSPAASCPPGRQGRATRGP